ncbi:MAG: GlsB/YeaQ/YmgE family stress response membrane protein [Candidatus Omnitrophica bacterium COP1]|nr:GlsB/YeaQ/YmgE family stress response membrane protein [Deltaproteobacteria bacterium]MCE7909701.1 GlsB/YeaQ/YmgE family stress response membrane protein [Candidatus Omnitrophica bacterium COP1]
MGVVQILVMLAVGAAAGWLATRIVKGQSNGLLPSIVIGVIGGLVGGWVLPRIGLSVGGGLVGALVGATIGSVLVLVAVIGLQRIGVIPRRIGR